jgi:hypothetical protein
VNLYHISQAVNNGYSTYDSAVVAAPTEDAAKSTLPDPCADSDPNYGGWVKPEFVTARLIGVACPGTEAGVICASFNAG